MSDLTNKEHDEAMTQPNWLESQFSLVRKRPDPSAEYTERTGRYLNLSERMAERSRNNPNDDTEL